MKRKTVMKVALSLILLCSLLVITVPASPVMAAGTDTVTVTKYAADMSVVDQQTISIADMELYFSVQGDGATHYYCQGPNDVDPTDPWNPDETDNLKDKSALKGTDIKDLCGAVGGAYPGGEIEILANDGWGDRYPYDNVYNPDPRQGPMVCCWWQDGVYSGADWDSGMLLAFFTTVTNGDGLYVFGNQDMHDCLPEELWHYTTITVDSVPYTMPSVHGLYTKYVSEINIYPEPQEEWELELSGFDTYIMSQNEFEDGVACSMGGHGATYTDDSGTWGGLPLWLLCGWVDDANPHGPAAFNDALAAAGYQIKVSAADYSYIFDDSTFVARNDDIIVANTLNGEPLPEGKYPLKLVGSALTSGGQKVSQITKIELLNLPTIEEWELDLAGVEHYVMSQLEFEGGVACTEGGHGATYTDGSGTWSGLPLWLLCGWVDDDVQHGEGAFNDEVAAAGYGVKVTATDGFSHTFTSTEVARNEGIIVANKLDDAPLPEDKYPLKLVGPALTSGKQKVGQIASITLLFPWELELSGASDYLMDNTEFETEALANPASWDDSGDIWDGLALWRLVAIVDDDDPTTFNDSLAAIGYDVKVIASDGYNKTFASADIARNDDRIVANIFNGFPLPSDRFPLRLVGPGLSGSQKVSQIVRIELVNLPAMMEFSVDQMWINFTWLRPYTGDTILANGDFSLPEGVTCDLSSDDVAMDIDGVNIAIPAGSFNKLPRREIYVYSSPRGSSPNILMTLNFDEGKWSLVARDIDASVINNYDGVDVKLSIGSIVGMDHIEMRIDSLSY